MGLSIKMTRNLELNYYEAAQIQMDATYSGDFRKGNKASDKLKKYNSVIEANFETNKSLMHNLVKSENPNVVIWIANVALNKNFETDYVIRRLKDIAQNKNLGIISFNAEMVLKTRHIQ